MIRSFKRERSIERFYQRIWTALNDLHFSLAFSVESIYYYSSIDYRSKFYDYSTVITGFFSKKILILVLLNHAICTIIYMFFSSDHFTSLFRLLTTLNFQNSCKCSALKGLIPYFPKIGQYSYSELVAFITITHCCKENRQLLWARWCRSRKYYLKSPKQWRSDLLCIYYLNMV